jgi:hypothetical protein
MCRLGEDEDGGAFFLGRGPQPAAFACRLGGRHDHSVVTEAKAGALGLNGAESADASIPGLRIWGPVPEAQAIGAGAIAAASSVLIAPQHPPSELFHRLAALVPDEVLPRASDTAHTLRLRLANSAFLHPIMTLAKGHGRGGRYIALNATTYPQPRRVQWGTSTVPEYTDADGDRVVRCLCYPHYYTKSPLLRMVEAMPPVVDELIKYAVHLSRPFLTTPSLASYPNSCELCIYYTAFNSKIGRHRDNFVSKDLTTYLTTRDATVLYEQRHSQLANSNVLIMSLGNAPMVLQLTFPRASTHDSVGTRSTYVVHPLFSVPCSCGTLFVFSPVDDLFYCHEAFFELSTLSRFGATGYRLAFVMRWLSPTTAPEHVFYAEGVRKGQMKPRDTEVREEKGRVNKNKRARRKQRFLE